MQVNTIDTMKITGYQNMSIMNMKGNFEKFECSVCLLEEETQEHVYQCKQIWKMKKKIDSNIPNYEEILWGNVMQKLKVARILKENMKIREQYKT